MIFLSVRYEKEDSLLGFENCYYGLFPGQSFISFFIIQNPGWIHNE